MGEQGKLGLGLIGCGSFGQFCLDACRSGEWVRPTAVTDVRPDVARLCAERYGVEAAADPGALVERPDVDIVHVATPPVSHYDLAMRAIQAGKHVLCEKPLALNTAQADEMLAAAERAGVMLAVNFVLRYNRATDAVRAVLDSGVLGRPLAAFLTNCAADSSLPPAHWFWDRKVSGGIFVEHGVHFFDLYDYWLGRGEVISARTETREHTGQEDRVTCLARHDGALVRHYHAFDQPGMMDRTDHRILCELGEIRVDGWIPLSISIDAMVSLDGQDRLAALLGEAVIAPPEPVADDELPVVSRNVTRDATRRVRMSDTPEPDKQRVYADSFRALLADQAAWIRDRSHQRVITERNGRDALVAAETAVRLAERP